MSTVVKVDEVEKMSSVEIVEISDDSVNETEQIEMEEEELSEGVKEDDSDGNGENYVGEFITVLSKSNVNNSCHGVVSLVCVHYT